MLYGLPIIADRRVLLQRSARIPRANSLETCLSATDLSRLCAITTRSQSTTSQLRRREVEQRLRQVGLVADDDAWSRSLTRLPRRSFLVATSTHGWKKEESQPEPLNFTGISSWHHVCIHDDFPAEWVQGDITLPIEYHFTPGKHADGLTINVPVTLLPQLSDDGFDWLVPGMLDELVVATIRALPKPVRRNLVPAPDVARDISELLPAWEAVAHGQPVRLHSARHSRMPCGAYGR